MTKIPKMTMIPMFLASMVSGLLTGEPRSSVKVSSRKHTIIPKGCKEFTIDGYTVVALNEKNARRKIEKRRRSV